MVIPRLTPKLRTPEEVYNVLSPGRCKLLHTKSPVWNCHRESHATVGVLTVPFSGQDIRSFENLKAMESHSLSVGSAMCTNAPR